MFLFYRPLLITDTRCILIVEDSLPEIDNGETVEFFFFHPFEFVWIWEIIGRTNINSINGDEHNNTYLWLYLLKVKVSGNYLLKQMN